MLLFLFVEALDVVTPFGRVFAGIIPLFLVQVLVLVRLRSTESIQRINVFNTAVVSVWSAIRNPESPSPMPLSALHANLLSVSASLLILSTPAVAQVPQTGVKPTESDSPAAPTPAQFVAMASSSDMFEIQSSELALRTTKRGEVRTFAQQMISDHTRSGTSLQQAAHTEGVMAAPNLTPARAALLQRLRDAPASKFDALYLEAQTGAHREAVALFTAYSERGPAGPLKAAATQVLPTLKAHLDHVQTLTPKP